MTDKRVYFGTKEKMSWVKAPKVNMTRSTETSRSGGVFLNGGGYVNDVAATGSHENYSLEWALTASEEIDLIESYYNRIFGDGLIYWLDPFAKHRNVLPKAWSAPFLAAKDAPSLFKNLRPATVTTVANTLNLPVKTAVYTLSSTSVGKELWIPVPTGESVRIGVVGSATSNGCIQYKKDNSSTWVNIAFTAATSTSALGTTIASTGGGITLRAFGTAGTLSLTALTARVVRDTELSKYLTGKFILGTGNSGMKFTDPTFDRIGYSAVIGEGLESCAVNLKEVGQWLS